MRYAQPYDEPSMRYSHSRSKAKHYHRDGRHHDHAPHSWRESHERRPSHGACRDTQKSHHSYHSYQSYQSHQSNRASGIPWMPCTYGTYILPLETPGDYKTTDPTECRCTCCPHPSSVSRSHHEHHRHQAPPQPPYDSTRRAEQPRWSEQPRRSGERTQEKRTADHKFVIDVVDNSRGPLRCEHGSRYPIVLSSTSSIASILSFLAPDRRRTKVVVHWNDGEQERLNDKVPIDEVRHFAKHLEVKESKWVHWE
ncbi:hypothetical protein B0J13DRAFT_93225 [Dactylonectria estremocensis]|uniref:Uncharacterized protein n=1 Tax=Dactylonectria estremocensis TaxID=1079267 RepID=A0A9P9ITR3_9HYPO|nr:hypothetical protein B0J13DRAFT_93225 [Dactylonectria estremocensis]